MRRRTPAGRQDSAGRQPSACAGATAASARPWLPPPSEACAPGSVRASCASRRPALPCRRSRSASAIVSLKRRTRRRKNPGRLRDVVGPAHRALRSRARNAPDQPAQKDVHWLGLRYRGFVCSPLLRTGYNGPRTTAGRNRDPTGQAKNQRLMHVDSTAHAADPSGRHHIAGQCRPGCCWRWRCSTFMPVQQSITLEVRTFDGPADVSDATRVVVHRAAQRDQPVGHINPGARPTVTVPPGLYDAQVIREQSGRHCQHPLGRAARRDALSPTRTAITSRSSTFRPATARSRSAARRAGDPRRTWRSTRPPTTTSPQRRR